MDFHTKYLGLLVAGVSAVSLSACSISHPNSMPSGYTYHKNTYKSPEPPASPRVSYDQRMYMDAAQAEQFRDAVYDLLKRITYRAGMPPKPIYVLAPDPMTTFYANIDNDLRESMRHLGYALSDVPTGAYVFAYDARIKPQPHGYVSQGEPNVELMLKIFDRVSPNARMLSEETGWYFIQGAEYLNIKPAHYSVLPSRRRIQLQAAGYDEVEDPRTVLQLDPELYTYRPNAAYSTREEIRGRMLAPPEVQAEIAAEEMRQRQQQMGSEPLSISRPVDTSAPSYPPVSEPVEPYEYAPVSGTMAPAPGYPAVAPPPSYPPLAQPGAAPAYDGPSQAVIIDSSGMSY